MKTDTHISNLGDLLDLVTKEARKKLTYEFFDELVSLALKRAKEGYHTTKMEATYKCYVNIDLNLLEKLAKYHGVVISTNDPDFHIFWEKEYVKNAYDNEKSHKEEEFEVGFDKRYVKGVVYDNDKVLGSTDIKEDCDCGKAYCTLLKEKWYIKE